MSIRRIGAVACLALAVFLGINGARELIGHPSLSDESGLGVSYIIGQVLPALLLLTVGLWLLQGRRHEKHRRPPATLGQPHWPEPVGPPPGPPPVAQARPHPQRPQQPQQPVAPGAVVCRNCSGTHAPNVKFCPWCGAATDA